MNNNVSREEIAAWLTGLQERICSQLENADGAGKFRADAWKRPGGGGGVSRVMTDGNIIEKGGVNFSAVWGKAPEQILRMMKLETAGLDFFATGVSIVLHPRNPFVPIIHMNVRYFEMSNGKWWFGGGIDLTPHYIDEEDARYFHTTLKSVCDRHDPGYYAAFKTWADDYFFIRHRNETRGIGGIFFDHLDDTTGISRASRYAFLQDVGEAFAPVYVHLMKKNGTLPYNDAEKHWQLIRRGRYVEFNLVWDRGTKFGLETDGRTESILMSLPPQANWIYDYHPVAGSREARTLEMLRKGVDWIADPAGN